MAKASRLDLDQDLARPWAIELNRLDRKRLARFVSHCCAHVHGLFASPSLLTGQTQLNLSDCILGDKRWFPVPSPGQDAQRIACGAQSISQLLDANHLWIFAHGFMYSRYGRLMVFS